MTPLLCPVWCAATSFSFSRTRTERPGMRSRSFSAVARPTMPPPAIATSTRVVIFSSGAARARGTTRCTRARSRDGLSPRCRSRARPRRNALSSRRLRATARGRLAEERSWRDGGVGQRATEERSVPHEAVLRVQKEAAHDFLRLARQLLNEVPAHEGGVGEEIFL